jgi:SPP1 gp7 family putative phage head morphogenesis protein
VLKEIQKKKFRQKFEMADADMVGNYAVVFNRLVKKAQKSIDAQFSEERIVKYIKSLYYRLDKINKKKFYEAIEKAIGVDVKQILKTDGLNTFVNAKSLETAQMIQKLKKEAMDNLSQNLLRLISAGKSLDTLYEEVTNRKKQNLYKSELVARNELKTFNSLLNDKRALNVGVKKAVWNAIGDERTRKCHKVRDGKEYDITKGLYSSCDGKYLRAGEEINCRCFNTYVVKFD